MPRTIRVFYKGLVGRVRVNFNWPEIGADSIVLVSASEYAPSPSDPEHSPRFIGDANVTVENIAPHGPPSDPNGGVTFIVNVDWPSPLDVVADITVLDAPPVIVQVQ